jgi:hypothetical protein
MGPTGLLGLLSLIFMRSLLRYPPIWQGWPSALGSSDRLPSTSSSSSCFTPSCSPCRCWLTSSRLSHPLSKAPTRSAMPSCFSPSWSNPFPQITCCSLFCLLKMQEEWSTSSKYSFASIRLSATPRYLQILLSILAFTSVLRRGDGSKICKNMTCRFSHKILRQYFLSEEDSTTVTRIFGR